MTITLAPINVQTAGKRSLKKSTPSPFAGEHMLRFRPTLPASLLVAAALMLPAVVQAQPLRSTGLASIGGVDPNYTVSVNGGAFGSAFVLVLSHGGGMPGFKQWIAPTASGSLPGGIADNNATRFSYSFSTTFSGITGFSFECARDDSFTSVVINSVGVSSGCDPYSFLTTRTISGLSSGTNTVVFNTGGNGITDGLIVNITAVQTSTVPEPASIALLGAGLLAVGGVAARGKLTLG